MNKKAHVTLLQVLIAVVITGVGIALFIGAANAIVNLWIERDEACGDSKHFVENLAISIDQVVSGKKDYDIEYIDIENSCILYGFGSENGNIEQYRPVSCVGRGCICICTESECSNSVSCMKIDDVKLINDIDKPFSAKGFKKLYIYKSDDVVIITEKRPAFLGEEVVVEETEPEETSVSLIGLDWDLPFDYIRTGTQIIFLNGVEYKNDKFCHPYFEDRECSLPYYADRYKGIHRGVDINADAGISVKAIADGEVIKVSSCTYVLHKGQGIYSNKEYTSIYCHVNGDESLIGKEVKKGDVIGTVLNMGESSHLHLEMYNKRVEVAAYSSYYRECGCSNDDECDNMLTKTGGACEILENDNYLIDGGKFFGLY